MRVLALCERKSGAQVALQVVDLADGAEEGGVDFLLRGLLLVGGSDLLQKQHEDGSYGEHILYGRDTKSGEEFRKASIEAT